MIKEKIIFTYSDIVNGQFNYHSFWDINTLVEDTDKQVENVIQDSGAAASENAIRSKL